MFVSRAAKKVRPFLNQRTIEFDLERPLVSFSFDDFPKTAQSVGGKLLEAEGWRGTYYVASSLMGTDNHHGPHFEANDLLRLEKQGHEIAGHTASHVDLSGMSSEQALKECQDDIQALKKMGITQKISNFAYPFGEVSIGLKRTLEPVFRSMRGIQSGVHYGKADLNELKANALDEPARFMQAKGMLNSLQKKPGWIIFFTHDICPSPSPWGCTEEQFRDIINGVKRIGADVLPVEKALEFLGVKNEQ